MANHILGRRPANIFCKLNQIAGKTTAKSVDADVAGDGCLPIPLPFPYQPRAIRLPHRYSRCEGRHVGVAVLFKTPLQHTRRNSSEGRRSRGSGEAVETLGRCPGEAQERPRRGQEMPEKKPWRGRGEAKKTPGESRSTVVNYVSTYQQTTDLNSFNVHDQSKRMQMI